MALLLAESLIHAQRFDPEDQLQRYVRWYRTGHLGATGECFDIGIQTRSALLKFETAHLAGQHLPFPSNLEETRSGNGSLMRLAPVAMAFASASPATILAAAVLSSRTTHGSALCLDACRYFVALLAGAYRGESKTTLLAADFFETFASPSYAHAHPFAPEIQEVVNGSFKVKQPPEIRGEGFVVRTLEAALWAFYSTDSFASGCLAVANLGADADTTAAVFGQIAGAFYGQSGIPQQWQDKIAWRDYVLATARELATLGLGGRISAPPDLAETVASEAYALLQAPLPASTPSAGNGAVSAEYWAIAECLGVVEALYRPLADASNPGPKAFRSVLAFDEAVAAAGEHYQASAPDCAAKGPLWAEFSLRILAQQKTKLALRLAKPTLVLPFGKK